jgi:hypothetical protein
MQVTGKPVPTSVGVCFIVFAVICAVVIMLHAKESQSPLLFVCIFGGVFVGVFGILGIAVVRENLNMKNHGQATHR